ncbi:hypothetical protein KSB_85890 [Ktedonobacter robiniae]|uniref:CsbD family protein n=1 Tax=Ktedonobacter robiniae TaxID=2778365 RepID=A0ABQ3V5G1_9CHLR|nr:hypothetical protein KSB_85890 [Ktedonobacter robiniae]
MARLLRLLAGQLLRLSSALLGRQGAQVNNWQSMRARGMDDLGRRATIGAKRRAQTLVPGNQSGKALLKRSRL